MRRSIPRKEYTGRNRVSKNENSIENGQISTKRSENHGIYYEHYPMRYMESLKSGQKSGGFIWNPPYTCKHRVLVDPDTQDRWVDCHTCKSCSNSSCIGKKVVTKGNDPKPEIEIEKRVSRRRS